MISVGLKMAQDRPQEALWEGPEGPRGTQECARIATRGPQEGPQEGSKRGLRTNLAQASLRDPSGTPLGPSRTPRGTHFETNLGPLASPYEGLQRSLR